MSAALEYRVPSLIAPQVVPGFPSIDERSLVNLAVSRQLPAARVFAGLKARHYRSVLVDAPTASLAGTKGRPQHYPRMSDREIAGLPVADLIHPEGAFVFLWVASPPSLSRRALPGRTRMRIARTRWQIVRGPILRLERAQRVAREQRHQTHPRPSLPPDDAGQDRAISPLDEKSDPAGKLLSARTA